MSCRLVDADVSERLSTYTCTAEATCSSTMSVNFPHTTWCDSTDDGNTQAHKGPQHNLQRTFTSETLKTAQQAYHFLQWFGSRLNTLYLS